MEPLVELLSAYRACQTLEARVDLANRIVERVIAPLTGYVHLRCLPEVFEDVMQEVLLAVSRDLARFNGATEREFWKWCYSIAQHKVADSFRTRGRQPLVLLDPDELWRAVEAANEQDPLGPAQQAELNETLSMLRAANPECYEVLVERYIFERSLVEIGIAQGKTGDAVRMQVNRCLEKAREFLAKEQVRYAH